MYILQGVPSWCLKKNITTLFLSNSLTAIFYLKYIDGGR